MRLPSYAEILGLSIMSAEDMPSHLGRDGVGQGSAAPMLTMPFGPAVVGRPGFLHGGAIGGLLEIAAYVALLAALDEGSRAKPISLTIDYRRGGREKPTYAQGRITRLGTRIANVEATAWQDDRDHPIAVARVNYLVREGATR